MDPLDPKDLINWRKVSTHLSGKPENIRSSYAGKKYAGPIHALKMLVKIWMRDSRK